MDINVLHYFIDIIKCGSMAKAAKANFVSQPALSASIKNLEYELKCKLFERSSTGLTVTEKGKQCEEIVARILTDYEEMKLLLSADDKKQISGKVKIGSVYSIGLFSLDTLLYAFFKKLSKINLSIQYLSNSDCIEKTASGELDLGIVIDQKIPKTLTSISCGQEPLVAIFSTSMIKNPSKDLSVEDLLKYPFISFSTHLPTYDLVKSLFKRHGIDPKPTHFFNNVELIKQSVRANLGFSVVPMSTVESDNLEKKLICKHFNPESYRETILIRRKNTPLAPHHEAVANFVTQNLFHKKDTISK